MLELARPEDRTAINALAQQVHEMHVSWRPDLYETVGELYSQERMMESIRSRSLYTAKIDGAVIGYLSVKIKDIDFPGSAKRRIMLLDEFVVHESCRGQGIGTMMMADLRALAKAFRCSDLQLNVYPQNDDAVGFYQKCGFMIQSIVMQRKV